MRTTVIAHIIGRAQWILYQLCHQFSCLQSCAGSYDGGDVDRVTDRDAATNLYDTTYNGQMEKMFLLLLLVKHRPRGIHDLTLDTEHNLVKTKYVNERNHVVGFLVRVKVNDAARGDYESVSGNSLESAFHEHMSVFTSTSTGQQKCSPKIPHSTKGVECGI
jgi:hypothetical protein